MSYGSYAAFGHQLLRGFQRLKLGAGGQVLHLSISTDGVTKVIGTDAGGALIWNNTTLQWDQLVTTARLPAGDFDDESIMGGCYAIAVAPSDSTRIYMLGIKSNLIGGLFPADMYVSSNSGATFTKAAGWTPVADMNPNTSAKFSGPKIAIDPANPDVCIMTTDANGAFITTNAGTTFTAPTGLPTTSGTSHRGIVFDPSSSVVGGKTQGIYVHSDGTAGVYHSTNGGSSFALVSGGPSTCWHGKCGIDGAYYVITPLSTAVWRLVGSTWTNITPSTNWNANNDVGTICPSLTAAGTLYACDCNGGLFYATDANTASPPNWTTTRRIGARTATDVPWLAATLEVSMTTGDWVMDPITPDKIWFAEGIGVWYTTAPKTAGDIPWISQSAGIEELVTNQIVSPPSGYPLIANWDRPVFTITNPAVYPSDHGPNHTRAINQGTSVDWASATPSFCVLQSNAFGEDSSYSTDKGITWNLFSNVPPSRSTDRYGGCIAASSSSTILWEESGNGDIYYTRDKGATAWVRIAGTDWGNNVADAGIFTITAMASGTAGVIRCTVASTGTLVTGQDVHFGAVVGTGGFGGTSFGTYNIVKVDSTHIELVGTTASGAFTSGTFTTSTGWHSSSFLYRQNLVADRVLTDTFYVFNNGAFYNVGTPGFGGGFFKVTFPGGVLTCARQSFPAAIMGTPDAFNVQMAASPFNAGHVLWTAGEGQSYNTGLQHSENSCVTWQKVPNITQNRCASYGAIKPGNDYPSIYFVGGLTGGGGYGSQEYGIYRSDSSAASWAANTPTWTLLGTFPLNCVSQVKTIVGDPDVWGKFYIGTPCGGCFYYVP